MLGVTALSTKVMSDGEETEGFQLMGVTVKYPTTKSFFKEKPKKKKNNKQIDSIVNSIETIVADIEGDTSDVDEEEVIDTTVQKVKVPDFTKIDTSKIQRIAYPENKAEFIAKLREQIKKPHSRIIHYGDSQLEGDRISAYIRNRLQGIYGGGGPGFIPIKQVYHQLSANVTCSDNWLRYAAFDPTQKRFNHKKYGVYTSLSRFTVPLQVPIDSVDIDTFPIVDATINVGYSKRAYANFRKFNTVTLHYGRNLTPTSLKVFNNDSLIKQDSLKLDTLYHAYTVKLKEAPTNLRFEFGSKISPDFYGLTLDAPTGVTLDNVAMRGASGTVFKKLSDTNFGSMVKQLSPDVFIFQYGGNTVPYLKDSLGVNNYSRYVLSNVNWVRRKAPEATILFIGPSDMTTSKDGIFYTYELLPYLNAKLKATCLQNNIAYWDMFGAMGGDNSMEHWVDQGLAGTDYTHFTPKGTKIISELFFIALYLDLSEKPVQTDEMKVQSNEQETF
ncbi:hypothetical protein NBRC110019_06210 [Neptunitalea chrysea]|uniref:SGNH hydrolase-type esterase domain-containing protein n=2 Tax=Neptunitalea chrysea TaxID=1647581 RepID=A0A9W6B598_9FLAO|nr:hypothetical protein NBRC110019_06210 [Neptunitalea chrysea]